MVRDETTEQVEVYAIHYGTRRARRSEVFYNYHVYGEPDDAINMEYYFWVIGQKDPIVVDTGFNERSGSSRGRKMLHYPETALARLGIAPADVKTVFITHCHYDHIGNIDVFPNATLYVQADELEFWSGQYAKRAQFATSFEPDDLRQIDRARAEGRLKLFSGDYVFSPTITLMTIAGHTPGQACVLVKAGDRTIVLASDAVHYYEELERDRPFSILSDLAKMYEGFDRISALARDPAVVIVAGHDPEVMNRFPPLDVSDPTFGVRLTLREEKRS
jgi:glyoxylase-like metal-dependent hydrolase (beta-lactamase superfamily II)